MSPLLLVDTNIRVKVPQMPFANQCWPSRWKLPESPALVATDEATPRRPTRPNDDGQVGLDFEEEEEEQLQEGDCWRELLLVVVRVGVVAVTAPHLASPLDLDEPCPVSFQS